MTDATGYSETSANIYHITDSSNFSFQVIVVSFTQMKIFRIFTRFGIMNIYVVSREFSAYIFKVTEMCLRRRCNDLEY